MIFDPLPIDVFLLGIYWDERKADYPGRSLQAPLADEPVLMLDVGQGRAWFESADRRWLLQVQHDRLYSNWRAFGGDYPGFAGNATDPGLLHRALAEFALFGGFCESRFGARPTPRRVEITKINQLQRDKDWSTAEDLSNLLPVVSAFDHVRRGGRREITLQFAEQWERESVRVSVRSVPQNTSEDFGALHLETRVIRHLDSTDAEAVEAALKGGNEHANDVFFSLLKNADRFGVKEV